MKIPRPVHPFPARMAPSIAWKILEDLPHDPRRCVLDPMAGSGTSVVVARQMGHKALGFDSDPLSVLIASVWASDVDEQRIARLTSDVEAEAKAQWRSIPQGEAYPTNADIETRAFLRYWFDATSRRQLTALARSIMNIRLTADRNLLWCGFSRLIIVKTAGASLAMDVAHSRPHRTYVSAPIKPVQAFSSAMRRVLQALPFKDRSRHRPPKATVRLGDARCLPLDDESIDVVITSPPYLNAIDYLRGHKMSLVLMNHSVSKLRGVRSSNIGTESGVRNGLGSDPVLKKAFAAGITKGRPPRAQAAIFVRYLSDMRAVLSEIRRVLKKRGQAALVIGDCLVRGIFVKNSEAIKSLASHLGLTLIS